ncbi:MAG TPA: response regulator, partial [bacterium]|nr:response regulator [bacterium]
NGEQALKICEQKEKPNIILLDIVMPGELDGYGILKKLKTEPKTSLIPVIVITIKDTIEDECRALELGAIDFITRPFFPIVVKKRIKNIADIVKINKFKEDISQIISHDLKNPLSIINLELQNIDFNKYPLEIKNMAESIRNSVFRMNNLLLVWSALFKIETYNYEFKFKKIDIIKLLKN